MAVVVVLDDNEIELQYSLSIIKSTKQFESVHGFKSVEDACSFIKEGRCDIVFLETEIKGINCFVLIDKLRKIKQDSSYVIITSEENYAYEAFQKGVMDYILKPLSPDIIKRSLEKLKKYKNINNYS